MSIKRLGHLSPSNTLFLLCDVQEKFRFMNNFPALIKNVDKLLKAGNVLEIPLIVTEQNPEKLGKTVTEFDTNYAAGIFAKTKFSMFIPELKNFLEKSKSITSIVLMGLESHICVEQTAMDLLKSGSYNVHIVADCVLSRTSGDRSFALKRLREMGCIISTSEDLIFKLIQDKNHPKFNEIRKLVAETSQFPDLTNKL